MKIRFLLSIFLLFCLLGCQPDKPTNHRNSSTPNVNQSQTNSKKAQKHWREISNSYNLNLNIGGIPGLSNFSFEKYNAELMTLFIQSMLDKGFLVANQFYPTLAHKEDHMELYFDAFDAVMKEIKLNIDDNNFIHNLRGPVKHTGFSRLL